MSTGFDYNTIRSLSETLWHNEPTYVHCIKKKSILKAYFPEILSCLYLFSVKLKLLVPTQVATSIDKYLDSAFLNLLEYI